MTPDPLRPVSLHTALLESIAERYRQDNDLEVAQHVEVLDVFEGLHERVIEANGVAASVGYHVKKLASETYRIRFDKRNGSIELCLDAAVYDALHENDVQASYTAVAMIGDLLLRYRKLTADGRRNAWRYIDSARIPEARKLADAMLVPASGIQRWLGIRPNLTAADVSAIYKVSKPTADRRLKVFMQHQSALLAAAEGALTVAHDVRLRIQKPGLMRRAFNFLINGTE